MVNITDVCMVTGENVIRGDKDSIKNLLEIFDGLLEYLKEELIEESQNGGSHHITFFRVFCYNF